MDDIEDQQRRVDSTLRRGLFFAFFWLAGIGSVIAFVLGIRAKRTIDASGGELTGNTRAWACILGGMIGILIWLLILAVVLDNWL